MNRNNNNDSRLTVWAMAVLLALGGCGNQPLIKDPEDVAWYQRSDSQPGQITIVDVSDPKIDFDIDWLGKGKSAGQGIGKKMDDWRCGDFGEAQAAAWVGLVCMIAAVPVGMVEGASDGISKDALDEELSDIRRLVDGRNFSATLSNRAAAYAVEQRIEASVGSASGHSERRLELSVDKIHIQGTAIPDFAFSISVRGEATLYDSDVKLHRFRFRHTSGVEEEFSAWHMDGYSYLADYLEVATSTIAGNIVDEALLVWYPHVEPVRITSPVFVLSDERSINSGFGTLSLFRDEVSWEAFPRERDYASLPSGSEISDIRYRLRVYRSPVKRVYFTAAEADVVFEAGDISDVSFDLSEHLQPCTDYRWTVRAEFLLDGQPRVTEWSGMYDQLDTQFRPWRYRRGKHQPNAYVHPAAEPQNFYYAYRSRCEA